MQTSSKLSRGYIIALAATLLCSTTGIIISNLSKTYSLPSLVLILMDVILLRFGDR